MIPPAWQMQISAGLAAHAPELAGRPLSLHPLGPPQQRTYSRQQWIEVSAGGEVWGRILIKQACGERAAAPAAEFAALQTLWTHFADLPDLHTPRPLLLLDHPPAVAMMALPGRPLFRVLQACRRPCRGGADDLVAHALHHSGRWLAHLQTLAPPAASQPAASPGERLQAAWHHLRRQNAVIDRHLTMRSQLENAVQGREWPADVLLHGDLTLRNILRQPDGGVAVLDTDLTRTGHPAYDLGYLDASLHFIDRWQALGRGQWYDAGCVAAARAALRQGYAAGGGDCAAADLALFSALRLLERGAELGDHLRHARPVLARPLIRRLIHPYFCKAAESVLAMS